MIRVLTLFLFIFSVWARPDYVEVWFVAEEEVTYNPVKIELFPRAMIASTVPKGCRPIDKDTCFHPQYGVLSAKDGKEIALENPAKLPPAPKASELAGSDLIKCRDSYHFDMFCGKAAKIKRKKVNLEIWIDTSSSMRSYDFSQSMDMCNRKSFVTLLRNKCNQSKFDVSVFSGSLKSLGGDDSLCFNVGINNQDRLISWIDASVAKNLIVITDTSQLTLKMTTFLKSIGAKIRGMDKSDTLFVSNLPDAVKFAAPYCR